MKDVETKMEEISVKRSTASFEPKAVVKEVLQDVANTKKKRRQGGRCLPEKEKIQWLRVLKPRPSHSRHFQRTPKIQQFMSVAMLAMQPHNLLS
jgi:hypothetical protein